MMASRHVGRGIGVAIAATVTYAGLAPVPSPQALAPSLLAQARDQQWPSERPPRPLAARDVKFPPYEIRTLANGLQVVAVLHHEQPAVSMRLIVRAGSALDPSDRPGVAALAAGLLDQGTTTRTAKEIAETIDTVGGALGTGAGTDLSFVNVVVMKDSFGLGLDLAADVARNPAFAQEEIDRQKQQVLSGLQVSYEDPDYVAGVVFDRLVYGFHAYGKPGVGTPQSVQRLTREDLQAFHRAHFAPNNALLAIVGDVTTEEAFAGAERAFGKWARRDVAPSVLGQPPEPTRRVIVVDRPGAVQTEIRVGHLGIPRKHPDYMAVNLAVKILGGEGANRLHRVLRSERGLTYGASADMETLKQSGDIVAETDTRSDATAEALRLIVEQFWELQRERVSERELADAKAYLAGSFPLTIETPDAIAMQVLNVLFYGLDLNELQTFRDRVNAVAVDDIQRVARAYLKPDRLSIVLVGDASRFVEQLQGVGFGKYERVPLAELDLAAAGFKREVRPAQRQPPAAGAAAASDAAGSRAALEDGAVRALIARAIEAKGGLDLLRSLKSITATAETRLMMPHGPVQAKTITYIQYPSRFVVDARTPEGRLVQAYVDDVAWILTPNGVRTAPDALKNEFRRGAGRDVVALLLRAAAAVGLDQADGARALRVRALPDQQVEGRALRGVELSAPDLEPVGLFFDPQSGLVAKQTYRVRGPDGEEAAEELFSDYQTRDGLQVAFKAIVRRGNTPLMERLVTDYKLNAPIDPAVWKKPS